jgi:hypothetical protein
VLAAACRWAQVPSGSRLALPTVRDPGLTR